MCLPACIDPPACEVNDQPVVSADVISLKASEATRKTCSVLFIILTNVFFKNNSQRLLRLLRNRQSVRDRFDVLREEVEFRRWGFLFKQTHRSVRVDFLFQAAVLCAKLRAHNTHGLLFFYANTVNAFAGVALVSHTLKNTQVSKELKLKTLN